MYETMDSTILSTVCTRSSAPHGATLLGVALAVRVTLDLLHAGAYIGCMLRRHANLHKPYPLLKSLYYSLEPAIGLSLGMSYSDYEDDSEVELEEGPQDQDDVVTNLVNACKYG